MKRYLRLAAWCLGLALAVTACGRAGRIVLPEAAEVTAIRVTAGDAVTLHTDRDWIGEFLQQAAEAVSTGMESVQDAPDQTGAVKVELGTRRDAGLERSVRLRGGRHLLFGAALYGHLPGGRGTLDSSGG